MIGVIAPSGQPPRPPWWQATGTPRLALILGILWLLVFLGTLALGLSDGEWPWYQVVLCVGSAVGAVVYLGGAIAPTQSH